jgi:hypothetical protein
MKLIALALFILAHRPGGKNHRQKRHGFWSKKAYGKFAKKRDAAKARLARRK